MMNNQAKVKIIVIQVIQKVKEKKVNKVMRIWQRNIFLH